MTDAPAPAPAATATVVVLEEALWSPGAEWRLALEHVASRLKRIAVLDVDAILAAGDLAAQLDALDTWAAGAGTSLDIDAELARFLDQHLSMHLKPDAAATRAVRAAAARGELHGASALPTAAAEAIARHAGVLRPFASFTGGVRTDADRAALRERTGATRTVTSLDQLGEG